MTTIRERNDEQSKEIDASDDGEAFDAAGVWEIGTIVVVGICVGKSVGDGVGIVDSPICRARTFPKLSA